MNILLVSGPGISLKEPYSSGIEAFIVSFATQLSYEGHTVDVLAKEAEANSNFKLVNPFMGYSTDQTDFFKTSREVSQFKNLNTDSYDIIHYNMFYPHLLRVGSQFKTKSILTLHSPADEKRIAVYKKLYVNSHMKFAAISGRVKSEWDCALNAAIPLIHNGIDLGYWSAAKVREPEYLLWSARITEEKNVAAAIRVAQYMQLPLKIAGRIVDAQYFDKAVKPHLNRQIEYVGHVTQRELNSLAKKAYAYLATATWQEPFGLAALEMLASGLPVVGFDTAVPPGWEHQSVLTTSSLHWQDLVELIKASNAISPAICREFASSMNIQKMTSEYLKLYRDVLTPTGVDEKTIGEEEHVLQTFFDQQQSFY